MKIQEAINRNFKIEGTTYKTTTDRFVGHLELLMGYLHCCELHKQLWYQFIEDMKK